MGKVWSCLVVESDLDSSPNPHLPSKLRFVQASRTECRRIRENRSLSLSLCLVPRQAAPALLLRCRRCGLIYFQRSTISFAPK